MNLREVVVIGALATMLDLVLAPIPGDSPTGKPVRDDPEFEQLKSEIDKLSGVNAAAVDWSRVVSISTALLEHKSKDLLVLSYGIVASFETSGFSALAEGLDAAHQLVSSRWESLFPDRPRGRAGAFEWLSQRGAASVKRRDPGSDERAAIEAAFMSLDTLDSLIREKLGEAAPGFGDLKGALREKLESIAEPPAPSGTAAAATSAPSTVHDLSSDSGRDDALRDVMTSLRELASSMRRADPRDARAYRLMRLAIWGQLQQLPPADDRVTRIPPRDISPDFLARLSDLGSRGEWVQVVEQAESRFSDCFLWLDLQFHVAKGMAALGASFSRAREAVLHECRGLLSAFPGLADLKYADETPFASDETQRWIAEDVLAAGSGGGSGYATSGPASEATVEAMERIAEAKTLEQDGKQAAAIQLLERAAQSAGLKERSLLRVEIANLLAAAKEPRLAVAQLELLDQELSRARFEQWDPATGVHFLQHFLRHQRTLARVEGESSPEARKADELYARLSRLDAVAALTMRP